jgi:hypothetical protein
VLCLMLLRWHVGAKLLLLLLLMCAECSMLQVLLTAGGCQAAAVADCVFVC